MAPARKGLTPEAAHARRVLGVAGRGPESTRELVVDLMAMLVDQGYRNSVTWYLAPSPTDDLRDVIFSVRSSDADDPVERRWHDRREVGAVLSDARRLASGPDAIEVWSGNSHGLQRLVLAGGKGRPLRFLNPEVPQFAGERSAATAAIAAWSSWNAAADAPPVPSNAATPHRSAPDPLAHDGPALPVPIRALETGAAGTVGAPAVSSVVDLDTLGAALQEALGEIRVEVELGSLEDLILDSLRAALAEVAPPPFPTVGAGEIERAAHQIGPGAEMSGLERSLQQSVSTAVETSLADQIPGLLRLLSQSLGGAHNDSPNTAAVDSSLLHIVPGVAEQIAATTAKLLTTAPDPVDVARRVAASVLSPSEIAETMVFRLRPLLDEHNMRLRHAEAAEADRDRHALDLMRQRVEQLSERMDRRLKRLEDEIRRSHSPDASPVPRGADGSGVPSGTDETKSPTNAGLRVLRHKHGG